MTTGNEDKIKGAAKDMKGHIKEGAGKLTGNKRLEGEGKLDQAEGEAQKKVGDVKKVFNK